MKVISAKQKTKRMGKILVTGGLGYIGSHTVVELIQAGYEPLVIDNLSESDIEVKGRIEQIAGKEIAFEQIEMCHIEELEDLFTRYDIDGVIHFAAFLLVNESVSDPLKYYHNNLLSTTNLLRTMLAHEVYAVVFSSAVYQCLC